jgi:hypothetical protein
LTEEVGKGIDVGGKEVEGRGEEIFGEELGGMTEVVDVFFLEAVRSWWIWLAHSETCVL